MASQAAGIDFGPGRYGDGVLVKDTTQVAWNVSIPATFHTSFWFIPAEVTTCVIWTASGSSGFLFVGFDEGVGAFFLEDHLSRRLIVPYAVSVTDRICLGVCQTASDRRLFVGKMGGDIEASNEAFAPVGSFTSLRLY